MADQTEFTRTLIHALAASGVRHAVVSPGSRNAPISLSLAAEASIADHSMHDERSAGFMAIGIGRATRQPAIVACTSGTAATELHPAIAEADAARVPLIAITADRPLDLYDVGAPQTIDQRGLFSAAVRWEHDFEPHPDNPPGYAHALAARLWAEATGFAPGPVHLNLRLREPLVTHGPFPGPLPGNVPKVTPARAAASAEGIDDLASRLAGRRAMIIVGPQSDPALPAAATALASAASLPILADPLSGLRRGHHPLDHVITNGAALGSVGRLDAAPPEVVVRIGAVPTSKALWSWLGEHPEVDQVIIDPVGWPDPMASSSMVLRADPVMTLIELAKSVIDPTPAGWAMGWVAADRAAGEAVASALAGGPPTDLGVARAVSDAVPARTAIFAGSSMSIRDLDTTLRASTQENRVFGNRGANGIDGLISSALGVATGIDHEVVVLAGDLSTLHDLTGLAAAARLGLAVTVIVVNNDGGGIFHFLPQAQLPEETFERHFGTPHGLDFVAAATGLGLPAHHCDHLDGLAGAMAGPGPKLIEVRTDRRENVEHHRRVLAAVAEAVTGL